MIKLDKKSYIKYAKLLPMSLWPETIFLFCDYIIVFMIFAVINVGENTKKLLHAALLVFIVE